MPEWRLSGILARPGEYKYGDVVEVKTAEELKLIARDQPLIPLTMGHPEFGIVKKEDLLGYAKPQWDEDLKVLRMVDGWIKKEHAHKVPSDLRQTLDAGEGVGISAGFEHDNDGNIQTNMFVSHVALLQEDKGVCPLGQCGVSAKMESSGGRTMKFEKRTETGEEVTEEPTEKAVAPQGFTAEQKEELKGLFADFAEVMKPSAGAEQEQPIEPEPEVKKEPEAPIPPVQPEIEIPQSLGTDEGLVRTDEMGNKSMSIKVGKTKE